MRTNENLLFTTSIECAASLDNLLFGGRLAVEIDGTTLAKGAEDAILKARGMNPALLVIDSTMPGTGAFELLAQLRHDGASAPVLLVQGQTDGVEEKEILNAGLAHLIGKAGFAFDTAVKQAALLLTDPARRLQRLPRVLHVEDSAQNRDIIRRYLQGEFEVLDAADGEYGLERAKRDVPDVVLMDLSLPGMDGWETTRRIKSTPHFAHVPVIAVTAHVSREDRALAEHVGCTGYLTKPLERELLLAELKQQLRKRDEQPYVRRGVRYDDQE